MTLRAATPEAVKLFHEGTVTLAEIEQNGVMIDEKYLDKAISRIDFKIKRLKEKIRNDPLAKKWRKRFGPKTNFNANHQLGTMVFEEWGYERQGRSTSKGKDSNDKLAFDKVDLPIVKDFFEIQTLNKANEYNKGIRRETIDGWAHPFIDLYKVGSFRSSASKFNIQNPPVRNPKMARIVRKSFIAPKGFVIGEIDYGKIEVCGAACYTQDPTLMAEVNDPKADMHRDTAASLFFLDQLKKDFWKEKNGKQIRHCAKNMFVFPQFYGSYFLDCAKNLWESIDTYSLSNEKGKSLKRHLKKHGIKELGETFSDSETGRIQSEEGTFIEHVRNIEKDFWKRRFKVYAAWKDEWWEKYVKRGYFELLTGFVCQGLYDWKQVCNYPIQGSSFHCLLWSLIKLHAWMKKKKLKSKLAFEIHDSIGGYFHEKEKDYIFEKAEKIMTVDIRKHWEWIIVPLKIEIEVAPPGGSWFDKVPYHVA